MYSHPPVIYTEFALVAILIFCILCSTIMYFYVLLCTLIIFILGQITCEPTKEQARHICLYPAGRTGTDYYVVDAKYVFSPKAKPT